MRAGSVSRSSGELAWARHVSGARGPAERLAASRCLLICPIPYFESADGGIWLERLWHRDVVGHLKRMPNLSIAAPRLIRDPGDFVRLEPAPGQTVVMEALPVPTSAGAALRQLPWTAAVLVRAVARSDLVHSGVAGWPYPLGLIANPLALLLRKPLVIVIESAFWRLADPAGASRKARIRARLNEAFARWSVRRARVAIFTSAAYRDSLEGEPGRNLVAPASWISDADILDDAAADAAWQAKRGPLRLVFASRLTAAKGTAILLAALRDLDRRGIALEIDVIGAGDLRPDCEAAARDLLHIGMTLLDPLPYGPSFHALLRRYHAAVVPTLSDEQPRIVYDAYAQAVPVIASDTGGNRECVEDGVTGLLVSAGDATALADRIAGLVDRPQRLSHLGMAALARARTQTHESMHLTRAEAIAAMLSDRAGATSRESSGV